MTDKEQIMIDGVDITGCTWCDFEPNAEPYCRINDGEDLSCEDNPNCYFKQLARKTRECEKLKEKFKKFFNIDNQECWDIAFLQDENARYRKALEEIEEVADDYNRVGKTSQYYRDGFEQILNIINKAKGE